MLAHCAEQHGFAIIASMATHIHVFLSKARFWPLTGCHESNMCFLWYHGHFFPNCKLIHSPILLSFHFFGTMIKISTRVEIQYKEEKPVMIPDDLIRHYEEKQYLQLRPTCRPIIQLVCGHTVAMNASLSQCSHLMELITIRNQNFKSQAEKAEEASSSNGQGNQEAEDLFGNQENVKPPQKKVIPSMLESNQQWLVTITVKGHDVQCSLSGKRPTRGDLCIEMEPESIAVVVEHLREASKMALQMETRWTKNAKTAP